MGTKDQDAATTRFAQWLLIGAGAPHNPDATYTVEDCWTVYDHKHAQTDAVMPNGRVTIAGSWKNAGPYFGPLQVSEFTQERVDGYTEKRRAEGAAPATIRREVAQVVSALNFCATPRGGKIIKQGDIEKVALPPNSPPRDRWLTMEEVQKLLTTAATFRRLDGRLTRTERFLWLALFTAGREEALLELTWDRVDFVTNTIHLNVPGRRLTKKRRADVTIATQLRPILERAYREREGDLVLDSKTSVWAYLQRVASRAGYASTISKYGKPHATGISPHVLRHTAATHMARRGVPLFAISKILGNTVAVCEKVYAKWVPDNAEGTVDMISGGTLLPAE